MVVIVGDVCTYGKGNLGAEGQREGGKERGVRCILTVYSNNSASNTSTHQTHQTHCAVKPAKPHRCNSVS